jgi:hypothetical protein
VLFAIVIVLLLLVVGTAVASARRRRHLTASRGGPLHLPPVHWNQSGLRRQRGRSRNSRNRRPRSGDSLPSRPPGADQSGPHLGPAIEGGKHGAASASADPEGSEVPGAESRPEPAHGDGDGDRPLQFENEPTGNGAVAIAGDPESDQSRERVRDNGEYVSVGGPANRADGERLIVQLRDGRSLEGWRRASGSANERLLILNVIAAFDTEGNKAPTTRTDSFILRSEISSIQRIDDS